MRSSVLVVGPDGVGKTTLVGLMSRFSGVPAFKCPTEKRIFRDGGRQSLVFDYTLTHFLAQTGHRFISDRSYPCEWVYSKVFTRETDAMLLSHIDRAHANIGTKILYLYSSSQPVEPDDIVPADRYWDVKRTYDQFMEWTECDVVSFDTDTMLRSYHEFGRDIAEDIAYYCMGKLGLEGNASEATDTD